MVGFKTTRDVFPIMSWFKRLGYKVVPFSAEGNDWDYEGDVYQDADAADAIFNDRGIRYDSTKQLSSLAIENGQVIGAIASGWAPVSDYGEGVYVFSFDVAVKKEFQNGLAGMQLIQNAIRQYEQEKDAYGDKTLMRLWVVNPRLVPILERRFGFEIENSYKDGSAHLIRY